MRLFEEIVARLGLDEEIVSGEKYVVFPGRCAYFENVKGVNIGVQAIQIENWQPSSTMKNIFLKNFDVQYKGNPPESITPNIPLTPRGLDARALPVWGFFAKNIDGLTLENISLRLSGKDPRKAAYIEDVSNVKVSGLSINGKSCGTDDMRSK